MDEVRDITFKPSITDRRVMISSVRPSPKYSLAVALALKSTNGSTATDGARAAARGHATHATATSTMVSSDAKMRCERGRGRRVVISVGAVTAASASFDAA